MKQTKKQIIWKGIIVGTILVSVFSSAFIKKGIVTATEIIGKHQNYNMEAEEQLTIRNRTKYRKIHKIRRQSTSITTKNYSKQQ